MTNVVVRKNPPAMGPDPGVDVRQRDGMVRAGEQINIWMTEATPPDATGFFDDLFCALDGAEETDQRFFIEATNAAFGTVFEQVEKQGGTYRFDLDGHTRTLVVQCREDKGMGTGAELMNIGVPEKRGNLIMGGYINNILNDLTTLINAGETTKAKHYLLAVIFLNRCQ